MSYCKWFSSMSVLERIVFFGAMSFVFGIGWSIGNVVSKAIGL